MGEYNAPLSMGPRGRSEETSARVLIRTRWSPQISLDSVRRSLIEESVRDRQELPIVSHPHGRTFAEAKDDLVEEGAGACKSSLRSGDRRIQRH
jgi:hypothetical protein